MYENATNLPVTVLMKVTRGGRLSVRMKRILLSYTRHVNGNFLPIVLRKAEGKL